MIFFVHFGRNKPIEQKPGNCLCNQRRDQIPMDRISPTSNRTNYKKYYEGASIRSRFSEY